MVKGCDGSVIADLIRNPEGQCRAAVIPSVPHRHTGFKAVSTGWEGTNIDRYGAAVPRFMEDLTWIGM